MAGNPSTTTDPNTARRPATSVTATSKRLPAVFGGTATLNANSRDPTNDTGTPGRTVPTSPSAAHRNATANRPDSGTIRLNRTKCGDGRPTAGSTHATAGSADTCAHTRADPPADVTSSGTTNADRAPPTACANTRTGSADGARTPDPSSNGNTRRSPATNNRAAAATYVAPAACCCPAVNRVAVPGEHTASTHDTGKSSDAGASACPGVHSALKKLWFAPTKYNALCNATPRLTPRVPSTNNCPCRSDTSPSQPGRIVTDGTSGAGLCPKTVGPINTIPRTVHRTGPSNPPPGGGGATLSTAARFTPSPPRECPTSNTLPRSATGAARTTSGAETRPAPAHSAHFARCARTNA
ncbi:hypothetical protein NUG22_38475, partial [Saccharothrix longispora]|nr:hypothetical protein [Saccharothrix longispora]